MSVNARPARKANHMVRIGDAVAAPQGAVQRSVRVASLGWRRGPTAEARLLYQEMSAPVRLRDLVPAWEPLLAVGDLED